MYISKRKYYSRFSFAVLVIGALIFIGALVIDACIYSLGIVTTICKYALIGEVIIIALILTITLLKNKGIKNYLSKIILLESIEFNLIAIGACIQREDKEYVELPKIKIGKCEIVISLSDLKIRSSIEKYLDSFSTALPERFVVEDYFITQNGAEVIIIYEDITTYKPEKYTIEEYRDKVKSMNPLELYFDKKHIVSLTDYPHFLISGSSGSGKSYLVNSLVIQAILKKYEIVICDIKRSYGLYKNYTDYVYEIDDILDKLHSVEAEMAERMEKLQPELDKNPRALAVDIGYAPKLVVIEEYISLQSSLEKKEKEELERVVKNLSVLARQSCIHLLLVMQSAGTENINATTRSNLTKILLGNAQSNILNATFGNGVDIPCTHTKMAKGEGLIQLDRITILRVPEIGDIENFRDVIS